MLVGRLADDPKAENSLKPEATPMPPPCLPHTDLAFRLYCAETLAEQAALSGIPNSSAEAALSARSDSVLHCRPSLLC